MAVPTESRSIESIFSYTHIIKDLHTKTVRYGRISFVRRCFCNASAMLRRCFGEALAMLRRGFGDASEMLRRCFGDASAMLQQCFGNDYSRSESSIPSSSPRFMFPALLRADIQKP